MGLKDCFFTWMGGLAVQQKSQDRIMKVQANIELRTAGSLSKVTKARMRDPNTNLSIVRLGKSWLTRRPDLVS